MQIEAVLFDVGDTLLWLDDAAIAACVGVSPAAVSAAALAMRRAIDALLEPALESGQLGQAAAAASIDPTQQLVERLGVPANERAAAVERLHQLDRDGELWCVVPPGAPAALKLLRSFGLRLAAVSNSDGTAAAKIEAADLSTHLEWVLDSAIEGVAKPDPALFLRAVERLGVAAERCLYVGDIYAIDVLGAQRAGLQALLFDRTGRYENPCPTVHSFVELVETLRPDNRPG